MSVIFTDIEVYRNFFYAGVKRHHDGLRVGFELSSRCPEIDHRRLRKILLANTVVGFNINAYDSPLLWYAFDLLDREGLTTQQILSKIKDASDIIIGSRMKPWETTRHLGIDIPSRFDCIDLIEPQPGVNVGLKTLNGRLHGKRLQDLPYEPDAILTEAQMEETADYCLTSDLDATENLFEALKEPLQLRVALGEEYGADFRSKSDSQIGEAIVRTQVERLIGRRVEKPALKPGQSFSYQIPSFLRFETPELQAVLDRLRATKFIVQHDGKVDLPKWLSETKIHLGSPTYQMGIGGLHSTESNRAVLADEDFALVDADVASMYPSIILMLGLLPEALGKHFLKAYGDIRAGRIDAKRRGKEIKALLKTFDGTEAERGKLEVELFACEVKDKGFKIALNGVFGKLGSPYSVLYAPHLLIAVTLTGQLTLLMLIERAIRAGIDVVSGNTDGVLFRCPRDLFDGVTKDRLNPSFLADLCAEWERDTGFDLEFAEYDSVYSQHVNSYFAIKSDGGHKRKGPWANPWSSDLNDNDPRGQLMKNPQMTICSDAALAKIKYGTPLEKTIYGCRDIRQFLTIIKADGGATWRGKYLGKVVRYYYSTDGEDIIKSKPHAKTGVRPKVPKTNGCAPCMTLPDEFPDDIDYDRYIREAEEILMELGYRERPRPPIKVRVTKANTASILWHSAVAA